MNLKPILPWAALLIWYAMTFSVANAGVRITNDIQGEIDIQKALFLLEDPEGNLTFQDLLSPFHSRDFSQNDNGRTGFGYSGSVYWVRLTVHKDPDTPRNWVLKHGYPHLDRVAFYWPGKDGAYHVTDTGDTVPFKHRSLNSRFFVFPIEPTASGTTYYLRMESNGAINFPLSIVDMETFRDLERDSQMAAGLFFGALLIMVAYNLLFFVFVRERLYFFYAFHVLFLALHQIIWFGFGFEYVWPGLPGLNNYLDMLAGNGLFFFLGLFIMDYLRTKRRMPLLHYVLLVNTLLIGLTGVCVFILQRNMVLGASNNLQMIQVLLLFSTGITGVVRRMREAYVFLLAWTIALCGALSLMGYRSGLLPEIPMLSHSIQIGILANVLLICLGLADRINHMKNSLARINKVFEFKNRELEAACSALENSEKRFRELADLLPQTVFEMNIHGEITYANRHGGQITGYTREDFKPGFSAFQLFDEKDHDRIRQGMEEMVTKRTVRQAEYLLKRKDGTRVPVFLYNSAVFSNGIPVGFRGVLLDMTQRKKTEELMVQTEKMMSVGGLAAGMAHEINNPLAGMIQTAQVLRNRLTTALAANEKAAQDLGVPLETVMAFMDKRGIPKLLDSMQTAGDRAAKIIGNMLGFARKSESVKSVHSLADILDTAIELARNDYNLKKHYDFKQIQIIKNYDPDLPQVSCEKSKIQQVVFNILKNASQAMNSWEKMPDAPKITLSLSLDNGMAGIGITDNGPGMDEETRKKVFEPFFSTKGEGQGTGLGLSVSYFIIVDDHGGKMELESAPGRGATFTIKLPVG